MRCVFLPLFLSAVFILFEGACSFYLPGVAPTTYRAGDVVPVYVNTITPSLSQNDQQLKSLISFDCTLSPPRLKYPLPRYTLSASFHCVLFAL